MKRNGIFNLILSLAVCMCMMPMTAIESFAGSDEELLPDSGAPAAEEIQEAGDEEPLQDDEASAEEAPAGSKAMLLQENAAAVSYIYYTAEGTAAVQHEGSCENYTTVTGSTKTFDNGQWYVVSDNVKIEGRIVVNGTANLILCDGATLDTTYGVDVATGKALNIYAQSEGTGTLIAESGYQYGAAIGGGNGISCGTVNIHGGKINATGYNNGVGIGAGNGGSGGNVNIYDGEIIAKGTGGGCAGIGGGRENGKVDSITIYGGTVNAQAVAGGAAAIGGGEKGNGGNITINGGNVTAKSDCTGIGCGNNGSGGSVTINGGNVTAIGNNSGAGIGGGENAACDSITINGGTVDASNPYSGSGAGIGGGENAGGGVISINGGSVTASGYHGIGAGKNGTEGTLTLGEKMAFKAGSDKNNISVSGDNDNASDAFGKKYFEASIGAVEYIYYTADGNTAVKHDDGSVTDYEIVKDTTTFEDGKWYIVKKDVTLSERLTVGGTANLILCDGATLTATKGIAVSEGKALNIYGQSAGTGALVAQTGDVLGIAAIGGNYNGDGGNITIHGVTVNATGSNQGAGIGGGGESNGGSLKVFAGEVTANGGEESAAIGGGRNGDGGEVIIYGGTVNANNDKQACGIGGGCYGEAGNITINGGTVNATGGLNGAAAIGGTHDQNGSVAINGGTVTAEASGEYSYAINHCKLTLGDGVTFAAGDDKDSITVTGNKSNASEAFGKRYFESPWQHTHVFDKNVAEAKYLNSEATCTEAAVYYKSCKCGEASTTETFKHGEALGHKYGQASYKWSEDKCTAERSCTVCEEGTSGHSQTETVAGTYVKDTDPDCTNAETGHYKAEFENTAFEKQQTAKDSVEHGEALGHKYGQASYTWDEDKCTAERSCTVCLEGTDGHSQTETVTGTYVKDTEADCTNAEKGHYTATFENEAFEPQQTEAGSVEKGEALGHKGGTATCTAKAVCEECNQEYGEFAAHQLKSVTIAAGNCKDGKKYDECLVCGERLNEKVLPGYSTSYVKSFKVSRGKKCFKAKWKKQSKAKQKMFNGYQIQYSLNSNFSGAKTVTVKKSGYSKKVSKLKAKKYYYVHCRSYRTVGGKTYYSAWSATKKVKTK